MGVEHALKTIAYRVGSTKDRRSILLLNSPLAGVV
jgi:hypothetical protein